MVEAGMVYLTFIGALLLVALAVGLRVLRDIFHEARERRRRRTAGELSAEDESAERGPPTPPAETDDVVRGDESADRDAASATCPQCGAVNDPAFSYCRQCASRLQLVG